MGLILGIDDAGRGPLIGPMVLAGVLIEEKTQEKFKELNIRDSKKISQKNRVRLSKIIRQDSLNYISVKISPNKIDSSTKKNINLNLLEAMGAANIIDSLNIKNKRIKVIVDCPSNNISSWRNDLLGLIKYKENLRLYCEHKADENHISVSAASILAKVERESEIDKLKRKYGNFGSGYPSDPLTKEFLKRNGRKFSDTGIFRKSWGTWKRIFNTNNQLTLGGF